MPNLRDLPSTDQLLQSSAASDLIDSYGRPLAVDALRQVLEEARQQFPLSGTLPTAETLLAKAGYFLQQWTAPSLIPVINATGVILHTNLGRAPLSQDTIQAMQNVATGYSNLEYDLAVGKRGSRLVHAEALLMRLTNAEAALVVNNNAAAVLLTLSALARRRGVVIARSQLVEIGGGFRVPDVMKQSGAKLIEVGTTNRVHLSDYENALSENPPALVMRAHRSNFRIIGFTTEPSLQEIARLAHQYEIPVVDDLGSGSLLDTARFGLGHEPTIGESLNSGADIVSFSGDKLLGGPQAGIIIGRADLIGKLRKHPLARAIRADKLCLAALSATLLHYLKNEAEAHIPIWQMISAPIGALHARATAWAAALGMGEVISSQSTIGGGSLPGETLPTMALSLHVSSPKDVLERLRKSQPPIIGRAEEGRVILDPRTVLPEQDAALLHHLGHILGAER
ncbi:MAG: L-seryl-tRNA(Sec) selenium transferase [Anaerolineales bacterium]|nr:L-seryl-tRNA(Sec) selenium transferase [Anaerolineales bacterium]